MAKFTRRQFGASLASAAALTATATPRGVQAQSPSLAARQFPAGFLWGCATSAYQIEGAAQEDGRGPSIWDTFSHTPGKIFESVTGDVADDSYHRYKEDVKLLKGMGAKGYRFSSSWSRVFPEGRGPPNEKGVAYYQRLVDELLANGIEPYVTLFHWDLPQALPNGWQSRDTAKAFADFAGFMAKRLSDRVQHFMTTNEFVCFTDLSYQVGQFAPGLKLAAAQVNEIRHHGLLAHGLGVQAIRANAQPGTKVGLAENPKVYVPVVETPQHIEAARRAFHEENAPFLTAVMEGRYTEYARADASADGYAVVRRPASFPQMASPWLFIGPEVIYWAVRHVSELWSPPALYITENGTSSDDLRTQDGRVDDTDRVMFLRNYLTHLQRAAAEGYPIKGYFLWSLMDNFEWADGFSKRFGIHYVDFKTQERVPKLSAEWYREVILHNSVR